MKILILAEGDAETRDSWSGTSMSIVRQLRANGHEVVTGDVEPAGLQRAALIAFSIAPDRRRWGVRYHLGGAGFRARSANAARHIRKHRDADVILQFGATFEARDRGATPCVLYCDGNIEQAWRGRKIGNNDATVLTRAATDAIREREARVYESADAILTFSERLRESFVDDFGIPAERLITVYAGPNFDIEQIPAGRESVPGGPPTILFSGRQFYRKGGDLLLTAFATVRQRIPDARLVILGPTRLDVDQPGVEFRGYISKETPQGQAEILRMYAEADVFCMPSRFEGFAISFLEAMLFELPCVSTWPPWTPPEMIVDGVTGYTVEPEDAEALADRLVRVLTDPAHARELGRRGRQRVLDNFTWPRVVDRIEVVLRNVAATEPAAATAGE